MIHWQHKHGSKDVKQLAYEAGGADGMPMPKDGIALGKNVPHATALINHGRWVALCPFDGCYGAEYVNFAMATFFCCNCRNAAAGHHVIPVDVPHPATQKAIEGALIKRAQENRNWLPHETVKQLRVENAEHGMTK